MHQGKLGTDNSVPYRLHWWFHEREIYWIVHFKWMQLVVHKLCLNKRMSLHSQPDNKDEKIAHYISTHLIVNKAVAALLTFTPL